jgi:hypothetical protein
MKYRSTYDAILRNPKFIGKIINSSQNSTGYALRGKFHSLKTCAMIYGAPELKTFNTWYISDIQLDNQESTKMKRLNSLL